MAILAYARVSTLDQDLSGQIEALTAAGATSIFKEKISGARADRPQLAKLMSTLKAGDTVIVSKLDQLGRSTRELLELIERIGAADASFKSLGDPLWDTTSSQGRLLSTLLAAIAEFERELIRVTAPVLPHLHRRTLIPVFPKERAFSEPTIPYRVQVPELTRSSDIKLNGRVSLRIPGPRYRLSMTRERRSSIVSIATLVVVEAAWLWLLFAFADLIFRR